MSLKEGTVLSDKWVIGKEIGNGACGIVYDVKPCNSNKKTYDYSLVVKVIPLGKGLSKAKAKEQERLAREAEEERVAKKAQELKKLREKV